MLSFTQAVLDPGQAFESKIPTGCQWPHYNTHQHPCICVSLCVSKELWLGLAFWPLSPLIDLFFHSHLPHTDHRDWTITLKCFRKVCCINVEVVYWIAPNNISKSLLNIPLCFAGYEIKLNLTHNSHFISFIILVLQLLNWIPHFSFNYRKLQ